MTGDAHISRRAFMGAACTAVLAAAAGALGGCQRGQEGTPGGQEAGHGRELARVGICLDGVASAYHVGLYVAQEKGYFADAGLDVAIVSPDADDGVLARVQAGSCEFGVCGQDALAGAFGCAEPLSVLAIAALVQRNTSGFLALGEHALERASDLEGKVLASRGNAVENAMMELVVEQDSGRFSRVQLGRRLPVDASPHAMLLADDVIDAVWAQRCWDVLALGREGRPCSFVAASEYLDDLGAYPATDFYAPLLIANDTYLVRREEEARAFVDAVRRGYRYARRWPKKAAKLLCAAVPQIDPVLARRAVVQLAPLFTGGADDWGVIDQKRWDAFFSLMWERKLIDREIPAHHGYSMDYLYDAR